MRPSWSDFQATKLEAAKRQLDAGIRCYFRKEEAEAAYTLALPPSEF